MENSSDTIGDRARNLPVCSAVPQPTALPRTPYNIKTGLNNKSCNRTSSSNYVLEILKFIIKTVK
jgi:hypothetical protein